MTDLSTALHEAEDRLQEARAAVVGARVAAARLTPPGFEEVALAGAEGHVAAALRQVSGVMDEDEVPA